MRAACHLHVWLDRPQRKGFTSFECHKFSRLSRHKPRLTLDQIWGWVREFAGGLAVFSGGTMEYKSVGWESESGVGCGVCGIL